MSSIYVDGSYLASNPQWHAEGSRWKAQQIQRILKSAGIHLARVAEVGCGAGEILNQLSQMYPNALFEGFDISPQAIALAQPRTHEGLRFHCTNFLSQASSTGYDVLLVMDVLEHLEDYFGFLRGLRGRAENYIFHIPLDMSVWMVLRNRLMFVRKSVGHLHYFNKSTALATLTETGYTVIDHFYTPAFDLAEKDPVHQTFRLIRRLAMPLAPDLTATVLGGASLLVLAR